MAIMKEMTTYGVEKEAKAKLRKEKTKAIMWKRR